MKYGFCKECKKAIPLGVDVCPECGVNEPFWGGKQKLIGVIVSIIMVIAAILVLGVVKIK